VVAAGAAAREGEAAVEEGGSLRGREYI
jgi:hypothetical protein